VTRLHGDRAGLRPVTVVLSTACIAWGVTVLAVPSARASVAFVAIGMVVWGAAWVAHWLKR